MQLSNSDKKYFTPPHQIAFEDILTQQGYIYFYHQNTKPRSSL